MRVSTIGYSIKQGGKNIWRNKLFSVASIATMGACIFLFGLVSVSYTHLDVYKRQAEGLQAVRDGSMYATVYNDKEKQAEVIAELAVSLSLGQGAGDLELENGKSIYLPYRKVTRENVSEFPCNP